MKNYLFLGLILLAGCGVPRSQYRRDQLPYSLAMQEQKSVDADIIRDINNGTDDLISWMRRTDGRIEALEKKVEEKPIVSDNSVHVQGSSVTVIEPIWTHCIRSHDCNTCTDMGNGIQSCTMMFCMGGSICDLELVGYPDGSVMSRKPQ